jgi:hypothetical protein
MLFLLHTFHTGYGAYIASCLKGTGVLFRVKNVRLMPEVKNQWSYTSGHLVYIHGLDRQLYHRFHFIQNI